MNDHCNTGATRWFGPDGRELTEREYIKLIQQAGTPATPETETPKPAGPAPGKGGPEK